MNNIFIRALGACIALAKARVFVVVLVLILITIFSSFNGYKSPEVATASTSSNLNFQSRLLTSAGNTVPDGNYHIEFKLYNANNTTGSSQGSCSGDANCLWTETRTTGNLVRVVNGYLTVNLGSVTAFPSTIDWDQEHWLGMRVGGSDGSPAWETIELTTDGTATGGKLKLTAVPYAFKAGQLAKNQGTYSGVLDFATLTDNRKYLLPDTSLATTASPGTLCVFNGAASNCPAATGSAYYIQNTGGSATPQAASNFNIQATDNSTNGTIGGIIRGASGGQTVDLFQLQDAAGVILTSFDASGKLVFGPAGSQDTNLYRASANTLKTDDDFLVGSNLTVTAASGNITTAGDLAVNGGDVTSTGSLNVQAATTNTLTLNTTGAGTVNLGTGTTATVNVGNATAATAVTVQGGTGSTAVNIQAAASGNINIGTNAVTGKVINIGSVGSTNNDTTIHIADSTAAIQTVTIGSTNSTSNTTLQGGSLGVTVKTGGSTGSTTAFQLQNAAGTDTYLQVNNSGTNNIITIGGNNSGEISSWASTTSLPLASGFMGSSTLSANGYIYAIGGTDNGSGHYSTVYYAKVNANGTLGSWATNTNALPVGLSRHSTAQYNGYIYVLGGYTGSPASTVYYAKLNADGSTGSWLSTTSMPATRSWHNSVVANGYMYVLGGGSSTTVNYAKISPDGTLGRWQTASSIAAGRDDATSIVANGYIYLLGGNNGSPQSSVYYAKLNSDGTLGSWNTTTAMSEGVYHHTSVVANGYVYVTGGYTGSSHVTTTKYAPLNSDGTLGSWTTATANLSGNRSGASAVIVNGYVYHIGGGSYVGTTVSYASTQRIKIGGALDLVGLGGENLADGETGTGGELTAGNTNVVGSLKVQGPATFARNLTVSGNFSAMGDVSLGGSAQLSPWASTSSLSTTRRLPGAVYGNNGYIYTVGGYIGSYSTTVEYSKVNANGTLGTWAATTSLNTSRQGAGVVVANGYIYAVGGYNGSNHASVEYAKINADGTLGTWATTASLNTARSRASSMVANGYIYIVGGSGSGNLASVEYAKINADGTLGTWATTASLNTARNSYGLSVANGYVYVIGGSNGSDLSSVEYAALNTNGTLDSWATTSSINTARESTTAVITNGYVYVMGGNNGSIIGTVEYAPLNANGTLGTWVASTNSLVIARDDLVSVVVNGYVYTIGGYTGSIASTVEYASTPRVRIAGALDLIGSTNGNLANGESGLGGELTAGNTNIVGALQVQGRSSFNQGVTLAGTLSVYGDTVIKNTSTTAFLVQNATATNTLFSIDTSGSIVSIANSAVASTVNIGNTTTSTAVNILGGVSGSINLGSVGSSTLASTTHIADTSNATGVQAVTIGSSAANTGNITIIQGGSNTTQAIQLLPNVAGGILIGSSTGTGTTTLGQSTATNTVNIGNGNTATGETQTINIGAGTPAGTGKATITIGNNGGASGVTLVGGTAGVNIGSGAGQGQLTNNGSTVNTTLAVADDSDGGALGGTPASPLTASASIDIYTSISIAQTTAGQTITLPTPTASTTYGRLLYISNVGTTSFTLLGSTLTVGSSATLVWSNTNGGASWQYAGAVPFSTGNFIQNGTSLQTTANFNIQSAASGSIGGVIKGASGQTERLLLFRDGTSSADLSAITSDGSFVANTYGTATTATTSGTGTNTTTVTLSGSAFTNGDVILIDNAGAAQDYYTRITAGGGTASLTVSPAVTFETDRTVTKQVTENIGATTTDYSSNSYRFFQGYFLGGVVTGAGSTTLSDGNLATTVPTFNLVNTSATTINAFGAATAINLGSASGATIQGGGALTIQSASATALNLDSGTTGALNIGTGASAKTITIGSTSSTALNLRTGSSFSLDGVADSTYDIGTSTTTGTIAVGGTSQTGITTLGRSGVSNTINIGASVGNAYTQTINIGTSGTSGSTTNVTIGSLIGSSQVVLQAGTGGVQIGANGTPTGQLYVSGKLPTSAVGSVNTGAYPISLNVQDKYAYVVNESGNNLQIIDISRPSSPSVVGDVATINTPYAVYAQGRYVYVGGVSNPLQIFDISDPTDPTLVGSVAGSNWTVALQVQGRYAYASNLSGNTLDIYDVSNPTAPKMVSSFTIGGSPWRAFVQGAYAYIISQATDSLEIYDISSPTSPVYKGSVSTGVSSDPHGIDVQGNYAYVTNEGTDNLVVIDVTDPTSPSSVGSVATGTDPYSISVQGRTAYVANFGSSTIGSYDVSNPTSPVAISTVSSGSPFALFVQGRYAYATDVGSTSLHIYDIGGAYIQQLEIGGLEATSISTTGNVSIGNSASIQGGLSVAGSLQLAGDIGVLGNASFINNGETENWKTTTSIPAPRARTVTATANGYAYVISGYSAGEQSTVYYSKINADGTVGSWTTAANALPSPRYSASGIVANGYIYVIGGYGAGSVNNTTYYAKLNTDGTVGSWQTTTSLPVNKDRHDSVLINGYIYVLGGTPNDTSASASASVYYAKVNSDGTLGSWTTSGNSMPAGRIEGKGVVAANGYIYYTGGSDTTGAAVTTVFYSKVNSDGSIGTWTTASNSIPATRQNHTAVVANGYMYVVGGENGGGAQDDVYYSRLAIDGTGAPGAFATSANLLPANMSTHVSIVSNGYIYTMAGNSSDVYYTSTQRIKIGGTLDLVGLNSANLADGESATGGELTAGNTNIVGKLQVTGPASFVQNVSISGTLGVSSDTALGSTLDVTGSAAFKKGTDFSTTGTTHNASFGDVSLVRLTGASAQTITGIAGGRDGEILTIINAAGQAATLSNATGSSAGNQIITGTAAGITLPAGGTITLIYDATAGYWRVTGSVAFSTGGYIQNGTTLQTTANFNIQSATSGSIGGIIQGATGQTANLFQLKDENGVALLAVDANAGFAIRSSTGTNTDSAFSVANGSNVVILGVNTNTSSIYSSVADGASAVGFKLNTTNSLANSTAKLFSLQNATVEKLSVDKDGNITTQGTIIQGAGNLTLQAATTNTLALNTAGAGTVNLGTTNSTTIGIGNTTAATQTTIQGGNGATAVNIQAAASGNINIGTNAVTGKVLNMGSVGSTANATTIHMADTSDATGVQAVTIGSTAANTGNITIIQGGSDTTQAIQLTPNVAGGILIGASAGTGTITLGQSTATNIIDIGSGNGTTATQTVNIAGGTSTTSGGKVVNIANGVPGAGTTNTVAIGTGGSTTGTVGITIGSNTAADHRVTIQGGNGATAVNIQAAASGNINIGTNAVTGKVLNIGSVGSTANDTTLHLADSTAGIQTVTIGSINSTSALTLQAGSVGTTVKSGSATAFQVQNAAGSDTMFIVDTTSTNKVKIGNSTGTGTSTTIFQLDAAASAPFGTGQNAYLGSMYYDTTQGKLQCYENRNGTATWGACGSAPNNIITLTPEYTGAVLNGTGVGTLTADFCSNESAVLVVGSLCANHEARNFYKWTSPQGTDQTYGVYVTYKLPATYSGFNDANTIKLTALTDNTTNANATLQVFRKNIGGNAIVSCGSATTINNTTNTWQQTSFGGDETACGFVGGDYVIFKINVTAKSSGNVYIENLDFTYTNQ